MRRLGAVMVLALLAAACGDTGETATTPGAPPGTDPPATTRATTTTTTPPQTRATTTTTQATTTTTRVATTTAPTTTTSVTTTTAAPTTTTEAVTTTTTALPTVFNSFTGGGDTVACDFDVLTSKDFGPLSVEEMRRGFVGLGGPSPVDTIGLGVRLVDVCIVEPPSALRLDVVVEAPGGIRAAHPLNLVADIRDARRLTADELLVDGTTIDVIDASVCVARDDCLRVFQSPAFQMHPRLPVGPWSVTLLADGQEALRRTYDVRHSTTPSVQVLDNQESRPVGGTVALLLSGFSPGQVVPLGFYQNVGLDEDSGNDIFELFEPLGAFSVNTDGWAEIEVTVPPIAPGQHCVASPGFAPVDCSGNYGTGVVFVSG